MQFSKMIFVGGFLPLFLIFSFLRRDIKGKNMVFLFFSLLFLLFQGLISLSILALLSYYSYFIGKRMEKESRMFFAFSIFVLLLPLLFFKYSIYLSALPLWLKGFMPFGISFYTFRLITYLADCRKGEKAEENFFHFAMYAFAFPVLSQGPILRYKEMREEIEDREWDFDKLSRGLYRFSFGLWKKLLLADSMGKLSNSFLPLELAKGLSGSGHTLPSFMAVFLSSLSFMLQIYLDFSAYTDMAIGIGEMVGFTIPENFHYPYEAKSVRDFWRRWHISLSLFFRDYIYIPLGGNRLSFPRRVLNLFLIWILTGMWHGASFNFILWGLYFFVLIVLELMGRKALHRLETLRPEWKEKMISSRLKVLKEPVLHIYTLFAVYLSWILFRYQDFQALKNVLKAHLFLNTEAFTDEKTLLLLRNHIFLFILAIFFSTSFFKKMDEAWGELMMRGRLRKERKVKREREGFYGMEDNDDAEEEGEIVCETSGSEFCEPATGGAEYLADTERTVDTEQTTDTETVFVRTEKSETEIAEGVKPEETEIAEEVKPEETEIAEEVLSEEAHRRHLLALRKIQIKTKWKIFLLDYGEMIYYFVKLALALSALALSFAAMAGQSYTPFLYNQF